MQRFEIEYEGRRFEIEAPDRESALAAVTGQQSQAQRPSFMEFLNQGIAAGLGAPIDLVTGGINLGISGINNIPGVDVPHIQDPFLGSANIAGMMSGAGVPVADPSIRPEGLMENVAAGIGGAAGGLVPFTGAARAMQGMGGVTGAAGQAMTQPFINAPGRAIASELAAGAGAGAGMDIATQLAPDNPYAQMAGALIGGVTAGAGPYAVSQGIQHTPLVGTATRVIQGEIAPFTQAGAMQRARNRVGGLVEDPQAAIAALNEPTIGNLSPAVSTGDRRLMALEQSVRDSDPVTDLLMRQREMESGQALREALLAPAQGADSYLTRGFMEDTMARTIDNIGVTLDRTFGAPAGVDRVSTALREASAPARQQAYDAAYAAPIDYSSEAGRSLENLITRVEQAAPGTISLANRMMAGEGVQSNQIMANVGTDGSVTFTQMPDTRQIDYITRSLNQMAQSGDGMGALGGQTDIGRIMSNLSRDIRDTLRVANPLYGDALQSAATPIGQKQALLFGQDLLNPSLPRDVAAERIAGMSPPELDFVRQGLRSHLDEVLANVRTTLSNPDTGMREAQQALARLSSRAVRDKIGLLLSPDDASQFFNQIDNAASLLDPRRSGVALFASARPQEEIRSILNSPDPRAAMAQLVSQAGNDPSGQALAGLKGAFLDELMARAKTANFDDMGEAMLSGRSLQNQLGNNRILSVANELLTMDERSRLSRIIDEFSRIETGQNRLPQVGNVMQGEPNSVVSIIARSMAARMGARAGQGTSGASLLTAHFASQRMNRLLQSLTLDRAEGLIRQAITGDRELFEALLTPGGQLTQAQERRLIDVLTSTAVGTAGGAVGSGLPDFQPEQPVPPGIPSITVNYDPNSTRDELASMIMGTSSPRTTIPAGSNRTQERIATMLMGTAPRQQNDIRSIIEAMLLDQRAA